jgi:hypothetical protein
MSLDLNGTALLSKKRCALVLGSHRSGTSVLTRSLLAAGVFLGDSFYIPRLDNPKGFFEDMVTNQENEAFLSRIGRRWNTLQMPDSIDPEAISTYQKCLKEYVIVRFEGKSLWALKDPRLSRLWPYWLPVFVEAGIEPVFILASRHPYSVASSLLKRDQMPEAQALALWAVYQLDALEALLQYGGLVVDYDLMMDRPRQELHRIARFLGVETQIDPDEVAKFESEFLADDLRHSRYPAQTAAPAESPFQALCLEIYGGLLNLAQLPVGLSPEAVEHTRTLVTGFRSELAISIDWMRAIDALQEAFTKASSSPMGVVAGMKCEARLYISEIVEGVPQAYSESRGAATLYPISNQRQTLRLHMPSDMKPLARIRLTPTNRPGALLLHHLALAQADGSEVWRWNGDVGSFASIAGLAIRAGAEGLLLLSLNDNPQFDLAVPGDVLADLAANASLVVELTPRPLLEVCSEILSQDDRLFAELRTDLLKSASPGTYSLPAGTTTSSLHLASDLGNIASLLEDSLTRRDQTIAQQQQQLRQMRDELLRAEAQLDLLKDVILGGCEEDRL